MAATNLIGLDIGSVSIRAVETTRGKDGPVIANFGEVPLPEGAVQAGVIHDEKAVTTALRHLWASTKLRGRDVVLGVTNPQTVVREMSVANLPEREMRRSLPFQVRDMLPLPVEKSLLDFYPLETSGDGKTVRGLLIAAPKEAVLAAVSAIEQAALHVARVDLASFALLRAAAYLDEKVEAIVDIGAHATSVVVHHDGVPLIVRTLPRGGSEITERIATRIGATVPEAEAIKCRVGLLDDGGPDTAAVVREAIQPLINEIGSSFAYLTSGDRQARVARVALSGGGALLPGLPDALHRKLDVDVVIADPMVRVRERRHSKRPGPDRLRSAAAVSIGLTLLGAA
jgi:type IV pilus assembly protein PilM